MGSLERTVEEVADVAASRQREVSRTADRVADGVPVGDRPVQEVTRQVGRTTDAALGTVTTVVRTVDVAVTKLLDRPVPGQPPVTSGDGDDPVAAPEETSTAPADRAARTDLASTPTRKSVGPRPRPASDIDVPRGPGATLSPAALDPTGHLMLPVGPRASGASPADDAPPASPGDQAPDLRGDATATSSADGGSGGLAVLDGRAADRAGGTSMGALLPGHRPRGPSFDPGFSPD